MVPQKASGRVGGRIPHFNWSIYRGGNFFLDEKSIENGLEGQKFLVVCLFWGGCHHPNVTASIHCQLKQYSISMRLQNNSAKQIPTPPPDVYSEQTFVNDQKYLDA